MLTAEEKLKIINEFKLSDDDTGSFEVQIAMLFQADSRAHGASAEPSKSFSSKRGVVQAHRRTSPAS